MITVEEYLKAQKIVDEFKKQQRKRYDWFKELEREVKEKGISKFAYVNKNTSVLETLISIRLLNALKANDERFFSGRWDMKIGELENISISQFLKCRGVGNGTLKELKEMCSYAGVSLKP